MNDNDSPMSQNGSPMDIKKRCLQCGREYPEAFLYCKEDGSELQIIPVKQQEQTPSKPPQEPTGSPQAPTSAPLEPTPTVPSNGPKLASRFMAELPEPDEIEVVRGASGASPLSRSGVIGMVILGVAVLAGGGFYIAKGMKSEGSGSGTSTKNSDVSAANSGSGEPKRTAQDSSKPPQMAAVKTSKPSPAPPKSGSGNFVGEKYPQTRERILSESDIASWDFAAVRYAINEIYARHGYAFQNPDIRRRFETFSWYHSKPGVSMEDLEKHQLSRVEMANAQLLSRRRTTMGHGE